MAERNPLRLMYDEFGHPAGISEYQPGDTLPEGAMPYEAVTEEDAAAGIEPAIKWWSPLRVRQATAAWWLTVSTAFGRSLVGADDAAAARSALELGTAATTAASDYATAAQVGDIAAALDAINGEVIP